MNHIVQNINALCSTIPSRVKIIAISKTKTIAEIRSAHDGGLHIFGESKVQELTAKHEQAPDIQWHFIGHLQTNKVKFIVPFVRMIQSVDSFRLLEEIERQCFKQNRQIDCLLQVHIARESTKFGFSESEIIDLLEKGKIQALKHIRVCGLMGMASFTNEMEVVRLEFRGLAHFFNRIRQNFFSDQPCFSELSMGMSDDYQVAIEEGATIVRIGSLIFAKRE